MRVFPILSVLGLVAASFFSASKAQACGGFFCGQVPVDQTAERIIFGVNDDNTLDVIVQIAYQGAAADFAWVVPVTSVPPRASLGTFPQAAITALDANTGPIFTPPLECSFLAEDAGGPTQGGGDGGVDVLLREEVGPFEVAVIESSNAAELIDWLQRNHFRVMDAMEPYVAIYAAEGKKFLALRLLPESDVNDIAPFRFQLAGNEPCVPLRLTALAAEPEMGIAAFIFANQRYAPKNWPDLEIDNSKIVWDWWTFQTNWTALVAQEVDAAGGIGWVTESASSTERYIELLNNPPNDPDLIEAQEALRDFVSQYDYITRLYTRLSAEEMTVDPIFEPSELGDVDRFRELSSIVNGEDICPEDPFNDPPTSTSPCDFTTCGAGGLCRDVETADGMLAGCACVPGAVARTTFDPDGSVTVACQDDRMSFLNPGDRESAGAAPLPDPCVDFDCGIRGTCVPVNLTPTCRCNQGAVAVGGLDATGARTTTCEEPLEAIPSAFYTRRLPDLPSSLPGGRASSVGPGNFCALSPGADSSASVLWLLIPFAIGIRRRRRRQSQ